MCTDHRCVDGITEHAGCNGWGWVTMGGRKYRRRSGARTVTASTTKQPCPGCSNTGMMICGCVPMTGEQFAQRLGETLGELQPA